MELDNLTILNVGKTTLIHLLQFWEQHNIEVAPKGNFTFIIDEINYNYFYEYLEGNIYNIENYEFSPTILERNC